MTKFDSKSDEGNFSIRFAHRSPVGPGVLIPQKIHKRSHSTSGFLTIGIAGFGPTTSCSRSKRSTRLSYIPGTPLF